MTKRNFSKTYLGCILLDMMILPNYVTYTLRAFKFLSKQEISTNILKNVWKFFETFNFEVKWSLPVNKKETTLDMMKGEIVGAIILEFFTFRPKIHSYLNDQGK